MLYPILTEKQFTYTLCSHIIFICMCVVTQTTNNAALLRQYSLQDFLIVVCVMDFCIEFIEILFTPHACARVKELVLSSLSLSLLS